VDSRVGGIDTIGAVRKVAAAAQDLKAKEFPYQELVKMAWMMGRAAIYADLRVPFAWYEELSAALDGLPKGE
jgi:hypothetical protein